MKLSISIALPFAVLRSFNPLVVAALVAPIVGYALADRPPPPRPEHPAVPMVTSVPAATPTTMCDDPIEGTWVGSAYRPDGEDWQLYTLHVRRDIAHRDGTKLAATLELEHWVAGASDYAIPQCADGTPRADGSAIIATGAIAGNAVRIDALSATDKRYGSCVAPRGYSLDHFVGAIDAAGELSVRNTDDAGYAHDRPYRFTRVSCHPN